MSPRSVAAAAWVLGGACALLALAYGDMALRARSAYLEGEQYMRWHREPSLWKAALQARFEAERAALGRERAAGLLSDEDLSHKLELARVEFEDAGADGPLKYAFHWFQTAAELCSPPPSRWSRLARRRMDEAGRSWKREMEAARMPYPPSLLE